MLLHRWLLTFPPAVVIGALVFSGCNSEHPDTPIDKPRSPAQGGADAKPTHKQVGKASWYGPGFQGQETASGETFDQKDMTAAHPSLPMGTKAEVTNLENGKQVEVTINDRGPYAKGRAIDLSSGAAKKLDMKKDGTAQVKIETAPKKKKRSSSRAAKPIAAR